MSWQFYLFRYLIPLVLGAFRKQMRQYNQDSFSIQAAREMTQQSGRILHLPRGMQMQSLQIGALPACWISDPAIRGGRTLLYLHGGGWVYGWMPAYEHFVGYMARAAKARALGIDYRLAPEHPFPAALEDCLSAYQYLLGEEGVAPERLVVMGDSAGGNLTLTLMLLLKARGLPLPACGVCISPATNLHVRGDSFRTNRASDVLLPIELVDYATAAYSAGHDLRDPLISPYYGDLTGLPPLLLQAGGGEMLVDDVRAFAARTADQGVDVTLSVTPRMWHVWQPLAPWLPEARRAVAEIAGFVQAQAPE